PERTCLLKRRLGREESAAHEEIEHQCQRSAGERHHEIHRHPALNQTSFAYIPVDGPQAMYERSEGATEDYKKEKDLLIPEFELPPKNRHRSGLTSWRWRRRRRRGRSWRAWAGRRSGFGGRCRWCWRVRGTVRWRRRDGRRRASRGRGRVLSRR